MQIKTKGQYLEFSDTAAFFNRLNEVNSLNDSALNIWDENMGFLSMRQIHFSYDTFMQSMPDTVYYNQYVNHPNYQTYQNYTAKYQSAFWMDPRDSSYWYNVFDPRMASVVNHKGIVMIGKVFFQFTRDYVKVMLDSSECKLPMLMSATADDTLNKIYVRPVVTTLATFNTRTEGSIGCEAHYDRNKIVCRTNISNFQFPFYEVSNDAGLIFLGWIEGSVISSEIKAETQKRFLYFLWYIRDWQPGAAHYLKIDFKAKFYTSGSISPEEISDVSQLNKSGSKFVNIYRKTHYSGFRIISIDFIRTKFSANLVGWYVNPYVECNVNW